MSNHSLSLRLTIWFSAIFLVGFIIFGTAMYVDLAVSMSRGRDRTLGVRASRCLETLESTRTDSAARQAAKFDDFAQATPEGNLIQVFDPAGNRLFPAAQGCPLPGCR